ncbi:nucleotide exchange factor GrpE [Candidatus Peregrinibacteria bacterium]|nr:nucleotide exchange factor GrpE [Candidatus Peregrinibacteria bacterium]
MADDLSEKIKKAEAEDKAQNQARNDQDEKNAKIEELTAQLARAMADLQNYKRRSEEEKASFVKYANAELLQTILPILDNLDRSVTHLPQELKDNEWAKGMLHIHGDLLKTFEKLGIKKITTLGEKLNPNLHEAMMTEAGEKDVILEEFEPGYTINGDVLKVAKVKVGDGSKK